MALWLLALVLPVLRARTFFVNYPSLYSSFCFLAFSPFFCLLTAVAAECADMSCHECFASAECSFCSGLFREYDSRTVARTPISYAPYSKCLPKAECDADDTYAPSEQYKQVCWPRLEWTDICSLTIASLVPIV